MGYEEAMKGDLFFFLLALRELPEDIKITKIKLEIAKDLFKSYYQVWPRTLTSYLIKKKQTNKIFFFLLFRVDFKEASSHWKFIKGIRKSCMLLLSRKHKNTNKNIRVNFNGKTKGIKTRSWLISFTSVEVLTVVVCLYREAGLKTCANGWRICIKAEVSLNHSMLRSRKLFLGLRLSWKWKII